MLFWNDSYEKFGMELISKISLKTTENKGFQKNCVKK